MKALIYYNEKYIKPTGGPSGYLYNLKEYRDSVGDSEISFLSKGSLRTLCFRARNKLHKILSVDRNMPENVINIEQIKYASGIMGPYAFDGFDIVHFHNTFDMYSQRKSLEHYKGKVILSSHSPKAYHKEYYEDFATPEEYSSYKSIFDSGEEFDKYSFSRADHIIFPCKGSEEPYYHSWNGYSEVRDENKIIYLPTGVPRSIPKRTRAEIRHELNIPEDRFVITFIGRHCEVKGYDLLISIFEQLDNVTVVCCGNPGHINPPNSQDWIEVGWTDDPASYLNASDLFILPNRETYFDLSLLEAISIGKLSLISLTGGNKHFAGKEYCGLYTYETTDQAVSIINAIKNTTPAERTALEEAQRRFYEEEYTVDKFYQRYKDTLLKISQT